MLELHDLFGDSIFVRASSVCRIEPETLSDKDAQQYGMSAGDEVAIVYIVDGTTKWVRENASEVAVWVA